LLKDLPPVTPLQLLQLTQSTQSTQLLLLRQSVQRWQLLHDVQFLQSLQSLQLVFPSLSAMVSLVVGVLSRSERFRESLMLKDWTVSRGRKGLLLVNVEDA